MNFCFFLNLAVIVCFLLPSFSASVRPLPFSKLLSFHHTRGGVAQDLETNEVISISKNYGGKEEKYPPSFLEKKYRYSQNASPVSFQYDSSGSSSFPTNSRTKTITSTATASPLKSSVNQFFDTLKSSIQGAIETGQHGLLRAIGTVDKTVTNVNRALENSTSVVVREGQKAMSRVYDVYDDNDYERRRPRHVIMEKLVGPGNNRIMHQMNELRNTWRNNRKLLYEVANQHQHEVHDVLQNAWSQINQNLGVQNLQKIPLGWYN